MKELLIVAPVVALYTPIVLLPALATNRFPPNNAMPVGKSNPEEMKELLIAAPVVASYSPIVPLNAFVTKISPPGLAAGIMQSAAETKPRRTARKAHESGRELYVVSVFIGFMTKQGKHTISQPA
jgi:hypothetical protein